MDVIMIRWPLQTGKERAYAKPDGRALFWKHRPGSRIYKKAFPYGKSVELWNRNYNELKSTLGGPQPELLDKLVDAQHEMEDAARHSAFQHALTFGIFLMAEAFAGIDEVTGELQE